MSRGVMNRRSAATDTSCRLKSEHKGMTLSMTQILTHTRDTQKYFQDALGSLSLFGNTDMNEMKATGRVQEERTESSTFKDLTNVPASLSEFCQQLRNKITQQSVHTISSEDRETLEEVMMAELSLIWWDLRGLPADPTLTSEENKEMRSQTFAEVLCICEQLYLHYLHMLKRLGKRAVFSHQVNCSRLASHLAMDLSRFLNAHSIQRNVAMGIKATRGAVKSRDGEHGERLGSPQMHTKVVPHRLDSRPHSKPKKHMASRQQKRTIQEKIKPLDLAQVYDLMPSHPELTASSMETRSMMSLCSTAIVPTKLEEEHCPVTRLKGCNSMPDLQRETLLEELEMASLPARPLSPSVLLSADPCHSLEKDRNPSEDLKRLLQDTDSMDESTPTDSETDVPSLIRALASRGSSRLKELKHVLQRLEEEEQQRMMKTQLKAARPQHPQAAVESVNVSTLGITRIAAARVTDRVLSETVNISMYPPIFNDLTGEIEPSSVALLDQNLFSTTEIKEVYKVLSESLSAEYLNFDEDPMMEPALNSAAEQDGLKHKHVKKLINPSLQKPSLYGISHRKRMELAANRKRPADVTSRAYAVWHQWWKSNVSVDDYLTYISNQETDYLSVLFHLYDSSDEEEEEEDEKKMIEREKIRRQQERIDALKRQKEAYQPGFWNVNTVLMGGLWKRPVPDEVEETDKEVQHVGPEDYVVPVAGPEEGKQIQAKLERIWTILCLPETQRLDMAIKYSTRAHRDELGEVTAAWEQAAQLIQQRECLLSQLEKFEMVASDPSRFFQHGHRGSSAARMTEATHREKLECQIAAVDKVLSKTIHHISVTYNDTVTYKGRPYREKMRWDRTEMLYWLQQERRVQALKKLVGGRASLCARLPPLQMTDNC
ncbi:coiled-coil domain-containing protein 87 isoform X3 [Salminus brasiliensis]|uniref:coiled-coil domain-containing protein 87 isoform X3 n=1 Tax=Salminus brasiliensis TaxID=930266 RepID=UPI003B839A82